MILVLVFQFTPQISHIGGPTSIPSWDMFMHKRDIGKGTCFSQFWDMWGKAEIGAAGRATGNRRDRRLQDYWTTGPRGRKREVSAWATQAQKLSRAQASCAGSSGCCTKVPRSPRTARSHARSWTAPVLWHFHDRRPPIPSGRRLPQSKTLSRRDNPRAIPGPYTRPSLAVKARPHLSEAETSA